jgi:hypothetical protein
MSLTKEDAIRLWSAYKDDFVAAVDKTSTLKSPKSIFEIEQVLKDGFLGAVFGIGVFIALALTSLMFYWWYYTRLNTETTYLQDLQKTALGNLKTLLKAETISLLNLNETASLFSGYIQNNGIANFQDNSHSEPKIKQVDLNTEPVFQHMKNYVNMYTTVVETKTCKWDWTVRVSYFMIIAIITSLVLGLVVLLANKRLVETVRNSYEKNQIAAVWEQFPEVIKVSPIYADDKYVSVECMVLAE